MVVVALAMVLGVIAGMIAYVYLSGVQNRAYAGARLATVYVARAPIPRGTTGAAAVAGGLIEKTEIPVRFRPIGSISDPRSIESGQALVDIPAQQVIVAALFGEAHISGGVAAQQIPPGDVAITISVDSVHGVAGLIQPGDKVDLLVELANGSKESALYQNVAVLATGTNLVSSGNQGGAAASTTPSSGLITFAVPLDAAERIALAESGTGVSGSIYLALVPPGNRASAVGPIGANGLSPSSLTPR